MLKSVAQINTASLFQQIQSVSDPISYMERAAQRYPDIFKASILGFGNSGDRKQYTASGYGAILTDLHGQSVDLWC